MTRGQQVQGVVEWYDTHYPRPPQSSSINFYQSIIDPESVNYYLNVQTLAVEMFTRGDVSGYRYDIIKAYLNDMRNKTFRNNDPALNL